MRVAKGKPTSVRLDTDVLEVLLQMAAEEDRSFANLVNRIIRDRLVAEGRVPAAVPRARKSSVASA